MKPKPKKESERGATFAEGGSTRMHKPQSANPQKPGTTAHAVKGAAPGAKAAKGGPPTRGVSLSRPATAGHTAPVRKGR
jgi:hypothetical protein